MTRLVAAEIARLLSRRFTGIALIVLLLGLGAYQLVVNDSLSPATGEQLAAAQRAYEQSHKDWVDNHEKYEGECRNTGGTPEECTHPGADSGRFQCGSDAIQGGGQNGTRGVDSFCRARRLHDRRQLHRR